MVRMRSLSRVVLVAALAFVAVPALDAVGANEARADEAPIEVGTQLVATQDVTLHRAEIQKGSRVSVTKLSQRSGRVEGVHVALADGHVVKVPMGFVHTYFRVAE